MPFFFISKLLMKKNTPKRRSSQREKSRRFNCFGRFQDQLIAWNKKICSGEIMRNPKKTFAFRRKDAYSREKMHIPKKRCSFGRTEGHSDTPLAHSKEKSVIPTHFLHILRKICRFRANYKKKKKKRLIIEDFLT